MDIRRFLKKLKTSPLPDLNDKIDSTSTNTLEHCTETDEELSHKLHTSRSSTACSCKNVTCNCTEMDEDTSKLSSTSKSLTTLNQKTYYDELDIGYYVSGTNRSATSDLKYKLLTNCWIPPENYNFRNDSESFSKSGRSFRATWLSAYNPWLAYLSVLKGALCKYCVLFPQPVIRGFQGSLITNAFVKYKDFNEAARQHLKTQWHRDAQQQASNFKNIFEKKAVSVDQQLDKAKAQVISINRNKLKSILTSILFCGSHDIALRGKKNDSGNFKDLLKFRIDAGDTVLKDHLEGPHVHHNAKYTSAKTQNELIELSGHIIREKIISEVNAAEGFSILADETCDIAGIEQLSLGVKFFDKSKLLVREEFLGMVSLDDQSAMGISNAILEFCTKCKIDMNKCIGQVYDGCSAWREEKGVFKL